MKRKNTTLAFFSGMFVMLLLLGTVLPAIAAGEKNVTIYPGVNIYVDDRKLDPKDANGNPVEVFIYNGSTYLPVRAVSEAVGKPVQWDGGTRSVYLGKHTGKADESYGLLVGNKMGCRHFVGCEQRCGILSGSI